MGVYLPDNPGNNDIYNRISGFTIQNGSGEAQVQVYMPTMGILI